jgi:hypothetical protein
LPAERCAHCAIPPSSSKRSAELRFPFRCSPNPESADQGESRDHQGQRRRFGHLNGKAFQGGGVRNEGVEHHGTLGADRKERVGPCEVVESGADGVTGSNALVSADLIEYGKVFLFRKEVHGQPIRQDAEISDAFGSASQSVFCPVHRRELHHLFPRLVPGAKSRAGMRLSEVASALCGPDLFLACRFQRRSPFRAYRVATLRP